MAQSKQATRELTRTLRRQREEKTVTLARQNSDILDGKYKPEFKDSLGAHYVYNQLKLAFR